MVRLDLERLVQKVPDRESFQHQDRALFVSDVIRQLDQPFPGDVALAGIGAEIGIVGDAVARMKIGHARSDRQHLAGRFVAGDEWKGRRLVEAGAVIDVNEIQPHGSLADAYLACFRCGHVDVFVDQGLWAPNLVHPHSLRHLPVPLACRPSMSECHRGNNVNAAMASRRSLGNQGINWLTAVSCGCRRASTLNISTAAENVMAK